MYESFLPPPPEDFAPARAAGGGNPLEQALVAERVTGPLADVARSVYHQESGSGADTRTSNAGAEGGMQIIPSTFASVADKGWNIKDPLHNARAGVRYLKQLDQQSGGDPALTAAGYYGGPGGLEKARKGIAVSDPRNPKAPNTLQYGQQVASRLGAGGAGMPARADLASPAPDEQSDTPFYTPVTRHAALLPPPPPEEGILSSMGTAVVQGAKSTARSIGAAFNTLTGDLTGVEDNRLAQLAAAEQDPAAKRSLMAEIEARKAANPDAGVLQAVGDVGSAALQNPLGTAQFVAEQAPNAVVSLGGGLAGSKLGALAGTPLGPVGIAVGGTVGFLAGMFLGNSLLEIGGKSIEKAEGGFTQGEANDALREGAVKGAVITGVDAATLGAGKLISRGLSAGAVKAGARAEAQVLAAAGVDITSGEKIVAALADPALRASAAQAGQAAAKAASTLGNRATQAGTILATETAGEGVGEYYGELAATGKADLYDAATEALAGFAQSAPETFMAMTHSASTSMDPKAIQASAIEQQRQTELAPVQAAADAGGSLSKAAMAGNTGPLAAAQYAAGKEQELAAQQQTVQAEQAANAPATDPLAERVRAITEEARSSRLLDALRVEGSPIDAKQFVNDLAMAQSPSTRPEQREQALSRLEYASAWVSDAGTPAPLDGATKPTATPATTGAAVPTANDLLRGDQLSDTDRQTLTASLSAATNPSLPEATRQAARQTANEIIGRNTAGTATTPLAPTAGTPALFAPKAAPAGSPEEVLAKARQQEDNAGQLTAMGYPDEAATATAQADLLREEASVRQAGAAADATPAATPAATETIATDASQSFAAGESQPAGVDVAAPRVATPAGTGTAQFRKRRATLAVLIKDGLNQVERRNDGNFYLVDPSRKRQFKLDNAADAQLARKAREDAIRAAADETAKNISDAQKIAGNYKKGRPDFEDLKIGIETPIGSERSGKAPDGTPWSVTMSADYGDVTNTKGGDNEAVDIYLAPNPKEGSPAFVIDQYNDDGTFDEHKVVLGVATEAEATAIYDAHFNDGSGPRRRKAVTAMAIPEFKTWVHSPAATQPAGKPNGTTGPDTKQGAAARPATGAPDAGAGVAAGEPGSGRADDRGGVLSDSARATPVVSGVATAADAGTGAGYVTIRVGGQERQVALVNDPAANDASPPRADGARRINKANAALLHKLAGTLGKKVQFFRDDTLGDGFVDPATPGTIYLNEVSTIHPLAVFGHEFLHQLRQSMPAAHASLMKVVRAKLKKDGAHKFRNDYYKADAGPNPNSALNSAELEEITSDIGGNFMADVGFWAEVFAQVQKDSPAASKSLIGRMATQLFKLVDKLVDGIKQGGFGSSALVNDLKGVRAAFKDALAQYMVANNLTQAGMRAEALKAEQAQEKTSITKDVARSTARSPEAGIHFSKQQRTEIDGRQYGTGMKGQELARLNNANDERLLARAYVYIDEGKGVTPETGVGTVPHEVKLPRLYDARVNADKLWNGGNLNATESAILDAGYSGYYVSGKDGAQGVAVVLGKASHQLKARPIAAAQNGAADAEPATASRGLMSKELNAIEPARIPGARLKNGTLIVPASSREAANDEMVRIGSAVRFSRARDVTETPAFAAWYGPWQNAAGGQDETTTNAGRVAAGPATNGRGLDVGGGRAVDAVQQRARLDQGPAPATTVGQAHFSGASGPLGKDGSPLVVYHGTRDDIESFDLAHPNRKDVGWLGRGIYTSSSADQAGDYAEVKRGQGGERILPLYAAVKNPYIATGALKTRLKNASQAQIDRFTESLKGLGHDGVVMNIEDADGHIELVAFEPGQVKSAAGNNGNFDPANGEITQSTKRPPRDPAIGDKTDVAKLPKGKPIPESAAIGSLEDSLALARSKSYAKGRQLKVDIQDRVLAAAKSAKVDLSAKTQETFKFLTGLVVKDAKLALQSNENAIGWYDKTVSRAIGALATVHPEIETDPKARLAFLWALATTSNGLKVGINFKIAEEVYRGWKETGVMPSDAGIGNAKASIDKGLALYNTLRAKMGDERLFAFMATEFEVGQIGRMLGEAPGGEWMPAPVLGSAVLGPKIGNGFFSNLNGYFSALTMDRWLMRTWGRMTGTLLEVLPEKVAKSRAKLAASIASMNDTERKLMAKLIGTPLRRSMTRAEIDAVSLAVQKTTMKPENRAIMDASPGSSRLRLDGNGHAKMLDGQKEAPAGPAERNWIRAVFTEALGELNTGGKAMTMSDLQALLWYPERRLYDAAKSDEDVADGYEDDEAPDYANAAQQLALKNGVKPEVITAAMDRAEKRGTVQGKRLSDAEKQAMLQEFRAPPEQAVQLAFEVAPDPADAGLIAQWGRLSLKDRTAITKKVKDEVLGEVIDAIGAKVGKTVGATGGFAGLVNPNLIAEYKQTQVPIEQARALAAAIGMALDQDSVALVDPRAAYSAGLIRINLSVKADKHATEILAAIQAVVPGIDGFTARGNNFDVLNFTDLSTEEVSTKITEALEGLDIDAEYTTSFGDTQSELVEKDSYEGQITGLRPGAGQEILGRIERARDRAREIVAQEIRSASDRGLQPRARKVAGRAAAARLDDVKLSTNRDGAGRDQGRGLAPLAGAPTVQGAAGPDPRLVEVAEKYARANGITLRRQAAYATIDPARAQRIAQAYEAMPHAPQDPQVKAAYADLIRQTRNQYDALVNAGYRFTFFDSASDPYQGNPWNAMRELRKSHSMAVYGTYDGYGTEGVTDEAIASNPMLADTGLQWRDQTGDLKPVLANDLFRAVHDAFGHGLEGAGFRAQGEENAWQAHVRLFTGPAVGAITSETRGQNSWLNYGPNGEANLNAKVEDTVFADQKTGLMPAWTWQEGIAGDEIRQSPARREDAPLVEMRKQLSVLESLRKCLG